MHGASGRALVFLHIPKTGGTSLHELLVRNFAPDEICPERFNRLRRWNPEELRKYRLFSGHFDREGVAAIRQAKDVVTILREPKSRILSLYYFWKAHRREVIERGNLGGPRVAKRLPLLDFLRYRGEGIPENIDNIQARTLLGAIFVGPRGEYCCPRHEVLDRAIEYLERMAGFGVMEEFDASVRHIFGRLGLPDPVPVPHARDSRTLADPTLEPIEAETISPDVTAELERLTEVDRKLYAYALARFRACSHASAESGDGVPGGVAVRERERPAGIASRRPDAAALQAEADALRWFHSIDLGAGVVTRGAKSLKLLSEQANIVFAPGVRGKSVLDIGAWDGAFSFEAERRGARDVLAVDHYSWIGRGWGSKAAFDLAKRSLRSSVRDMILDVPDTKPGTVEAFDVVLFLGVFYHLKHPLLALEQIAPLARELLVLDTETSLDTTPFPVMRFFPADEWGSDASNWFVPNIACVQAMLRHVGFRRIAMTPNPSHDVPINAERGRFIFHAWKS